MRPLPTRLLRRILVGCLVVLSVVLGHKLLTRRSPPPKPPPVRVLPTPTPDVPLDFDAVSVAARRHAQSTLEMLLSAQSTTLDDAAARYMLKTRRSPPPNYDKWFTFARKNRCLIDEYDRIFRDFQPFHQLVGFHFRETVERGKAMFLNQVRELKPKRQEAYGLAALGFKDGQLRLPPYRATTYAKDIPQHLFKIAHLMPDMEFLLNGRDEPRVVFDTQRPTAAELASQQNDHTPFHITPYPTGPFFRNQSGCGLVLDGAVGDQSHLVSFFSSSASSDFTTDLWPLLSMTKISPCFADILFPAQADLQYYYRLSRWSPKLGANEVPWASKKDVLYWRGGSTGGRIISTRTSSNHHLFPRFRLLNLARNHTDLIDARMTTFAHEYCKTEDGCMFTPIIREYSIFGPKAPRREVFNYKYALDIDGNTFSGRFLSLLRSGSLVFKATVYEEFFNDWIRPYEHFIPVKYDLSDLVEKVEWAIQNDDQARRIQEAGKLFATNITTDAQNDCYMALVLLEYARLYNTVP
ncbi:CAP10 domain-containing protein [Mycena kentingensis (nom. inval.)]|nr:CAP10 domain-containing protein [Mycena kentingensis (nom. inval.)]